MSCPTILDFNDGISKSNKLTNFILATLKLPNTSLFNLRNVKLSPSENIVLGLELKFLPKTQSDTASIQSSLTHSLESYINRIRTNIYFNDAK